MGKSTQNRYVIFLLILTVVVVAVIMSISVPGDAQAFGGLTENGTAAFMGIGVTPQKILHVSGTGPGTVPLFVRNTDSAGFIIERTPTNRWVLGVNESPTLGNGFVLSTIPTGTQSVPRLLVTQDGNVGIGTTSPAARIDVVTSTSSGVKSYSHDSYGINGISTNSSGVLGSSIHTGVEGVSTAGGFGVFGDSPDGRGVYGHSTSNIGVYGKTDNSSSYAGYFEGNVNVTDNLTANYVKGNGFCLNGDCNTSWPKSKFGSWQSDNFTVNTNYPAATDGFITANLSIPHNSGASLIGYTDSNNPPTTIRAGFTYDNTQQDVRWSSFTMPVRKGDWWRIASASWGDHECSWLIYWLPLE